MCKEVPVSFWYMNIILETSSSSTTLLKYIYKKHIITGSLYSNYGDHESLRETVVLCTTELQCVLLNRV
jgi:hypothetical protein